MNQIENLPLIWHADKVAVNQLKIWTKNPRKITKEAFSKLKERIVKRGFHDVIKVDADYTILSGNQRKKALVDLGIMEVTVLIPNRPLTEDERSKVSLESNTNDGEWDFELLKSFEFGTLKDIGLDENLLANVFDLNQEVEDDEFNVDKEIEKIKSPIIKPGDLIEMGPHKLICGSCTDKKVLNRLFGMEKASLIYSDPPYNIKLDYGNGVGGKGNYGGNVKDDRTDSEYKDFLKLSMEAALSVANENIHFFYWSDESYIWLIQTLYRELGISNKRVCLWIKNGQNPVPSVAFNKCYEPCTYGVRGKPWVAKEIQNLNEVMNKEMTTGNDLTLETLDHLNIWLAKRLPGKEYAHATSKPPTLHQKAIRRCTKPGDIILDGFSGSASTLIAAEQLKRRFFGVELEPVYCDLAIRRYEALTGNKANIIHEKTEEGTRIPGSTS